jgi:hypothetical protein
MNITQLKPPLSSFAKEACEAEIQATLEKYQVDLVFIGITRNGYPAGGQFVVEPRVKSN